MPRLKADQRKDQLIAVATRLFARTGYEATTTAAIAQAAGVTEPILYRHFKGKQELFVAIVRNVSEETMRHWNELLVDVTDPAERIRTICEAIPDHIRKHADSYHVLHGALSTSRDKKVLAVIREHYVRIAGFFTTLIRDGEKAGEFRRSINPNAAAMHLLMTGIGYAMLSLNLDLIGRPVIDQTIELMLEGLSKK